MPPSPLPPPSPHLQKLRNNAPEPVSNSLDVNVDGGVPLVHVGVLHESEVHDTCAVDHDVDGTEGVLGCGDEGLDGGADGDVGGNAQEVLGRDACRDELGLEGFQDGTTAGS